MQSIPRSLHGNSRERLTQSKAAPQASNAEPTASPTFAFLLNMRRANAMSGPVIFDMDGLLIDSEPLWHAAEKSVFATVGIHLTTADCLQTTGLRVDEVVRHWYQGDAPLAERIVDRVIGLIAERGVAKPGVHEAIALCAGRPTAIASSSATRIIHAVLKRLDLHFDVVVSAEHETHGKPHPAVYLTTARRLGVEPARCVALEDSPNGVRSAKAAGMRCIAVPDQALSVVDADLVLPSLLDLRAEHLC